MVSNIYCLLTWVYDAYYCIPTSVCTSDYYLTCSFYHTWQFHTISPAHRCLLFFLSIPTHIQRKPDKKWCIFKTPNAIIQHQTRHLTELESWIDLSSNDLTCTVRIHVLFLDWRYWFFAHEYDIILVLLLRTKDASLPDFLTSHFKTRLHYVGDKYQVHRMRCKSESN